MSLGRLEEHRRLWKAKPLLADVYAVWFEDLLATVAAGGRVLEVGAGPGLFSAYARQRRPDLRWVASDVLATTWNDVVADGLRLPFRTACLDGVLALDLIHHLARPAAFFAEVRRVLEPGGHLAVVEPWVSPLSFPVYRWLHREGCRLRLDPWAPFGEGTAKDAFEGDAAVVWRMARDTRPDRWRELGFAPPEVTPINGFAYLLSLGFRKWSLLPRPLAPALLQLDRWTQPAASLLGLRARLVWRAATRIV